MQKSWYKHASTQEHKHSQVHGIDVRHGRELATTLPNAITSTTPWGPPFAPHDLPHGVVEQKRLVKRIEIKTHKGCPTTPWSSPGGSMEQPHDPVEQPRGVSGAAQGGSRS